MISTCPLCGHAHPVKTSARAIGTYSKTPTNYVANYVNARIRNTRERAQQDYCEHWNSRRNLTPLVVGLMATMSEGGERFDYVALVDGSGSTLLVAGVPQAFEVNVPSHDYDALTAAFNDAATVTVERAALPTIEGTNAGPVIIPLLTIQGK